MRTARYLTLFSILILLFSFSASAQRKRKPAPRATPKPTPVNLTVNPVVTTAKQQVSNQLHNVTVFVDIMGPIAVAIESNDKEAAARRLKKEAIDANELNKRKLIAAIRGLRDGLVALETDFRTKPQLTPYLSKIQGISTLCAQSEDSAIAGRFVASKDPLRQITLKLNDTLAVLPGPLPAGTTTTANPSQSRTIPTRPVSSQSKPASSQSKPVSTQSTATGKRDVALGMTPTEVLASSWGAPGSKRVSTTPNGKTEVWLYSANRAVYFFNGEVSNIIR